MVKQRHTLTSVIYKLLQTIIIMIFVVKINKQQMKCKFINRMNKISLGEENKFVFSFKTRSQKVN